MKEETMAVETTKKYCPICGKPVTDPAYERFGELCCSEAHAEEYVKEIRAQKVQAVAAPQDRPRPEQEARSGWFGRRGGCC
jgi:hypothetical protein